MYMKKTTKVLVCMVNILAVIALVIAACVLPSKIAEKNLSDVFG